MHVVVVGAGIIGVTTAYYLRQRGCDVTVIERNNGAAQEASFANAGVIAPAYVAPWAQPGMPAKVLGMLFRPEAPVIFRPTLDGALWRWLRRWFSECDLDRFRINKARMQRVATYSRGELHALRARYAIDYEQQPGFLQLFRTDRELQRTEPARAVLREAGIAHRLLSAAECRALEPALNEHTPLAGGLHLPDDETGNCAYFARRLKEICDRDGVRFRFGGAAGALQVEGGRVRGLRVQEGVLAADAVVVAAGIDSGALLAGAGVGVPLWPVKGYSATVSIARHDLAPLISVMDETYKVAITRLGKRLRIAGTAEIGTRDLVLRTSAQRTLLKVARDWYPGAAAYSSAQFWVGARPMLPDGAPLLGRTPVDNLYVNIGHGSTGWAMACGSARAVADVVTGQPPDIDLDGLTLDRYREPLAA